MSTISRTRPRNLSAAWRTNKSYDAPRYWNFFFPLEALTVIHLIGSSDIERFELFRAFTAISGGLDWIEEQRYGARRLRKAVDNDQDEEHVRENSVHSEFETLFGEGCLDWGKDRLAVLGALAGINMIFRVQSIRYNDVFSYWKQSEEVTQGLTGTCTHFAKIPLQRVCALRNWNEARMWIGILSCERRGLLGITLTRTPRKGSAYPSAMAARTFGYQQPKLVPEAHYGHLLTTKQMRRAIDSLELKNMIWRASHGRRAVFGRAHVDAKGNSQAAQRRLWLEQVAHLLISKSSIQRDRAKERLARERTEVKQTIKAVRLRMARSYDGTP